MRLCLQSIWVFFSVSYPDDKPAERLLRATLCVCWRKWWTWYGPCFRQTHGAQSHIFWSPSSLWCPSPRCTTWWEKTTNNFRVQWRTNQIRLADKTPPPYTVHVTWLSLPLVLNCFLFVFVVCSDAYSGMAQGDSSFAWACSKCARAFLRVASSFFSFSTFPCCGTESCAQLKATWIHVRVGLFEAHKRAPVVQYMYSRTRVLTLRSGQPIPTLVISPREEIL